MKEMNVYNLSVRLAFTKNISYVLWIHDNATGNERLLTFESNEQPLFYYEDGDVHKTHNLENFSVIMVEALKKGTFKITGYMEIN